MTTAVKFYTRSEIAALLKMHPNSISRLVREGKFERPCTPPNQRPRWKQSAIDHYINAFPITKKEEKFMKSSGYRA